MSNDVEQRARDMGWVPLEEFRSGPEKWVDAETFIAKGEQVLPIVRSQNRRLEQEVQRLRGENQHLAGMFKASQESISELQSFHEQNLKTQLEAQKRRLATELQEARDSGDTLREVEIQTEIAGLKDTPTPVTKPVQQTQQQPTQQKPQIDPDFQAWMNDNPWYGVDQRKTAKAEGIAHMLRSDERNDHLQGRAFFDHVVKVMTEGQVPGGSSGKVGGGRPTGDGGGGGGGGSKSYDSLPPEAKEACIKQGKKLVGEGRAFKDQASWQKYYADLYYKGEQ